MPNLKTSVAASCSARFLSGPENEWSATRGRTGPSEETRPGLPGMWHDWQVVPLLAYFDRFHSPNVSLIRTPFWFSYWWQLPQNSDLETNALYLDTWSFTLTGIRIGPRYGPISIVTGGTVSFGPEPLIEWQKTHATPSSLTGRIFSKSFVT